MCVFACDCVGVQHVVLCVCWLWKLYSTELHVVAEKEGREVEAAMNAMGPGEATFIKCDMSKEAEIKVSDQALVVVSPLCQVNN